MKELITHIQDSGELDKYWLRVDNINHQARKEARKLEKQRKKILMGDEYVSSGGSEEEEKSIDSWDESSNSEDDKDSEYGSQDNESQLKNFEIVQGGTFDVGDKSQVRFGGELKDTVGELPDSPSPNLMNRTVMEKGN